MTNVSTQNVRGITAFCQKMTKYRMIITLPIQGKINTSRESI